MANGNVFGVKIDLQNQLQNYQNVILSRQAQEAKERMMEQKRLDDLQKTDINRAIDLYFFERNNDKNILENDVSSITEDLNAQLDFAVQAIKSGKQVNLGQVFSPTSQKKSTSERDKQMYLSLGEQWDNMPEEQRELYDAQSVWADIEQIKNQPLGQRDWSSFDFTKHYNPNSLAKNFLDDTLQTAVQERKSQIGGLEVRDLFEVTESNLFLYDSEGHPDIDPETGYIRINPDAGNELLMRYKADPDMQAYVEHIRKEEDKQGLEPTPVYDLLLEILSTEVLPKQEKFVNSKMRPQPPVSIQKTELEQNKFDTALSELPQAMPAYVERLKSVVSRNRAPIFNVTEDGGKIYITVASGETDAMKRVLQDKTAQALIEQGMMTSSGGIVIDPNNINENQIRTIDKIYQEITKDKESLIVGLEPFEEEQKDEEPKSNTVDPSSPYYSQSTPGADPNAGS